MKTFYALSIALALIPSARAGALEDAAAAQEEMALEEIEKNALAVLRKAYVVVLDSRLQSGVEDLRDLVTGAPPRIGIVFGQDHRVTALFKGPAAEAGVRIGDLLTHIDNHSVDRLEVAAIVQLILQAASSVQITVERAGTAQTFLLTKRSLPLPSPQAEDFLARLDSLRQHIDVLRKRLHESGDTYTEIEANLLYVKGLYLSLVEEINAAVLVQPSDG